MKSACVAQLSEIDKDNIRGTSHCKPSDVLAVQNPRTFPSCHPEHIMCRHPFIRAIVRMRAHQTMGKRCQAHLGKHASAVVAASPVHSNPYRHTNCAHLRHGTDWIPQTHVLAGAVSYAGTGTSQNRDVLCGMHSTVDKTGFWFQPANAFKVSRRSAVMHSRAQSYIVSSWGDMYLAVTVGFVCQTSQTMHQIGMEVSDHCWSDAY